MQRERDSAQAREEEMASKLAAQTKLTQEKQFQYESLNKDFNKAQERLRTLMGSESALATQRDALEANQRAMEGETDKAKAQQSAREQDWANERQELNGKLQEMLTYNEKVRDECLKKVVAYKEKATDYKTKVRNANGQI
jgi:chromosome segregation ATPase